jgi:hypothetical protein
MLVADRGPRQVLRRGPLSRLRERGAALIETPADSLFTRDLE